ncbi:hypothetical protein F2P81_008650 [Scophthalmus maximus]|uniref:Uncharacterized protein n=1 Tax=Scophthalmus maximus TaxID=52904 RepID=A0A6A4SSJ5_SCOMX|nr:hypothetical protein F2P81_008650 [Scophthalmus maximus]
MLSVLRRTVHMYRPTANLCDFRKSLDSFVLTRVSSYKASFRQGRRSLRHRGLVTASAVVTTISASTLTQLPLPALRRPASKWSDTPVLSVLQAVPVTRNISSRFQRLSSGRIKTRDDK